MKFANLFEQLTEDEPAARAQLDVVALLVGVDNAGPSFRNYLRETPAIEGDLTMGDAARAYLTARLAALTPPAFVPNMSTAARDLLAYVSAVREGPENLDYLVGGTMLYVRYLASTIIAGDY